MTRITLGIVLLSATAIITSAPAQAQNGTLTRSFVSSAGVDGNPCTITQPCATFAHAYTKISANGIIAALDPGKYGPLTIIGPVTVNGNGWAAITAPAGGNGITVTAGASDNVELIGLEIDGAGAAYNGIVLNLAGYLTVTNCTLQNFIYSGTSGTGNGIFLQPSSGTISFVITNTMVANNSWAGIYYVPSSGSAQATGVIDHIVAINDQFGIVIITSSGGGSTAVAISNGTISNNSANGIYIDNGSAPLAVSIDNTELSGNQNGIAALDTTTVTLGRSVITANTGNGVDNGTSPNTFYSYQDNRINGNGTSPANDVNGTGLSPVGLK